MATKDDFPVQVISLYGTPISLRVRLWSSSSISGVYIQFGEWKGSRNQLLSGQDAITLGVAMIQAGQMVLDSQPAAAETETPEAEGDPLKNN